MIVMVPNVSGELSPWILPDPTGLRVSTRIRVRFRVRVRVRNRVSL